MRKLKKISTILLTAVMLLMSMSLNALAVSTPEEDPGSNVSGGATGTFGEDYGRITFHKFEGIGDESRTNDGTELTITSDFGDPLPDVQFKVYPVTLKASATEGSTNIDDYNIDRDTYYWLITDGQGEAVLDKLPKDSIYYVEEMPLNGYTQVAPFFVSIPMTTADGSEHIYDVHIYPKNQELNFEKEPVENTDGSNIRSWKISSTIPADIADADVAKGYSYVITDTLGAGLVFDETSLDVFAVNAAGTKVGSSLVAITDYTLTPTGTAGAYTGFKISFTQSGFDKLESLAAVTGENKAVEINITFDSIITTDDDNLGELENEGGLEFTNNDGATFEGGTDPVDPPKAPSFEIKIVKTDAEKSEPLGGAEFYLYNDPADATAAIQSEDYEGNNPLKDSTGNSWVLTSDGTMGLVQFSGLTEGVYYLVESEAPASFNKMTNYIKLEIIDDNGTYTYKINDEATPENVVAYVATVPVENSSGFTLPLTGGAGTLWFTLIGLLLIGAAIVIYAVKKKQDQKA